MSILKQQLIFYPSKNEHNKKINCLFYLSVIWVFYMAIHY